MALRKAYQEQLETLRDRLTQMGKLCTLAVQLAVEAVKSGDEALAERTRQTDEVIEEEEQALESLCLTLLLRQQPVAGDLRRITAAQKMISDLERIGDQAGDIAELSPYVVVREETDPAAKSLCSMSWEVVNMVSASVDAYVRSDLALAQDVITWDDKADEWFARIKEDLIAAITADNTQGEYCLDILMVAKYLERIGDHAANVAEWVEYSIRGKTGE